MKKKKRIQIEVRRRLITCILLGIIVFSVGFYLKTSNITEPKINEVTTSFISFNNKNTTDMLRINNIEKMKDKIGNSRWNSHSLTITITGEKNQSYEIVLYPLTNPIEEKYVRYSVKTGREETKDNLLTPEATEDGGKVLYRGSIQKKKTTIRLWISEDYEGKISQTAFEVKIKPR